ncbi:hypothetical protein BT69DRAFT_1144679 [Atractiella rhizophila]|nr:hypothetical protein BT69DRAFT_1144679 [Atractiella rhizophila]
MELDTEEDIDELADDLESPRIEGGGEADVSKNDDCQQSKVIVADSAISLEEDVKPIIHFASMPRGTDGPLVAQTFDSSATSDFCNRFIRDYFDTFSGSRAPLLDFYAHNATFSYQIEPCVREQFPPAVRLKIGKKIASPYAILNAIRDFPSCDTVCKLVDGIQLDVQAVMIHLQGIYQVFPLEDGVKHAFQRTFVVARGQDPAPYSIRLDLLYLRRYQDFPENVFLPSQHLESPAPAFGRRDISATYSPPPASYSSHDLSTPLYPESFPAPISSGDVLHSGPGGSSTIGSLLTLDQLPVTSSKVPSRKSSPLISQRESSVLLSPILQGDNLETDNFGVGSRIQPSDSTTDDDSSSDYSVRLVQAKQPPKGPSVPEPDDVLDFIRSYAHVKPEPRRKASSARTLKGTTRNLGPNIRPSEATTRRKDPSSNPSTSGASRRNHSPAVGSGNLAKDMQLQEQHDSALETSARADRIVDGARLGTEQELDMSYLGAANEPRVFNVGKLNQAPKSGEKMRWFWPSDDEDYVGMTSHAQFLSWNTEAIINRHPQNNAQIRSYCADLGDYGKTFAMGWFVSERKTEMGITDMVKVFAKDGRAWKERRFRMRSESVGRTTVGIRSLTFLPQPEPTRMMIAASSLTQVPLKKSTYSHRRCILRYNLQRSTVRVEEEHWEGDTHSSEITSLFWSPTYHLLSGSLDTKVLRLDPFAMKSVKVYTSNMAIDHIQSRDPHTVLLTLQGVRDQFELIDLRNSIRPSQVLSSLGLCSRTKVLTAEVDKTTR